MTATLHKTNTQKSVIMSAATKNSWSCKIFTKYWPIISESIISQTSPPPPCRSGPYGPLPLLAQIQNRIPRRAVVLINCLQFWRQHHQHYYHQRHQHNHHYRLRQLSLLNEIWSMIKHEYIKIWHFCANWCDFPFAFVFFPGGGRGRGI